MVEAARDQQPGARLRVDLGPHPAQPLLGGQIGGQRRDLGARPEPGVAYGRAEAHRHIRGGERGQRRALHLHVVVDARPGDGQEVVRHASFPDAVRQIVQNAQPERQTVLQQGEEAVHGTAGAVLPDGSGHLQDATSGVLTSLVRIDLRSRHGVPNVRGR
ncbi:hypothetical protein DMB42_36500 [Nonomuraea sp. WAC 01424]|nr:hypothetical protein DMB42_36500 [Nonomuraea sp. WAC 01424]